MLSACPTRGGSRRARGSRVRWSPTTLPLSTPTRFDVRTCTIAPAAGPGSSTSGGSKRAGARFWVILVLLVAVCVVLAMTTWREIGRLFGL